MQMALMCDRACKTSSNNKSKKNLLYCLQMEPDLQFNYPRDYCVYYMVWEENKEEKLIFYICLCLPCTQHTEWRKMKIFYQWSHSHLMTWYYVICSICKSDWRQKKILQVLFMLFLFFKSPLWKWLLYIILEKYSKKVWMSRLMN